LLARTPVPVSIRIIFAFAGGITVIKVLSVALFVLTLAASASAETLPFMPVPEIDPSAVMSGLGLLGCGMLMIRARVRR